MVRTTINICTKLATCGKTARHSGLCRGYKYKKKRSSPLTKRNIRDLNRWCDILDALPDFTVAWV